MELPIYRIIINEQDETGCSTISLVDSPAVEMPFLCFENQEHIKLAVNDEKRVISGIAMLADTPIYRNSPTRGEYYIIFDRETIRKMVEKYAKNGNYNLVNLQHNQNGYVDCVHMIESMIIDKERGLCPIEFQHVPDGSWYVSYHIDNEQLWNEIKNTEHLNGFSLEVLSELELIPTEQKLTSNITMTKFNVKLAKMLLKLSEITTDKETLIINGEIEVGQPVFVETEEGLVEAADGEYTLEDGTVIVVEASKIAEIRPVEAPAEEEETPAEEEILEDETPVEEEETPAEDEKDIRIAELEAKVAELEALLAERDAKIAELEAKVTEQEEKLKLSVETPIIKKGKNTENKALKYFA
jgi:uncharacterized coiled-coil protein SlyX